MSKWMVYAKKADFKAIAARYGIDQVIARIIRNRDVCTNEEIDMYLGGDISSMHDAHLLKDADKAADIIIDKINHRKHIRIVGDYDIDGVCSTYILLIGLKKAGAIVDIDIPDRIKDGYGISKELIDLAYQAGTDTIITCDNGISAIEQVAYAKSLGMGVIHISYSPNSVADYAIMMMLMGLRRMPHIMERASIQDYTLKGKIGRELPDCTVGVIGTGRIGRTVIRHLSGFGCKMLAYDLYENEEVKQYAEYTDLDTLLKNSDVITLHAPATDDNYHMIDAAAIEKMKQDVVIINCARGALMDTDALIDGIESGKVGFAGLDVVEHESGLYYFNRMGEPLHNPKLAILRSYSNVLVSPHTAFYTEEAVANMAENSIIGAMKYMNGEDTPYLV